MAHYDADWWGDSISFILELIAANCIPPHSYTVKQNLIFSSSLLETKSEDSIVQYYPKSLVSWIKKATQLQTLHDVTAIAKIIREDFINELRQKLAPIGCNDLYLENAWNSLLTGIWGICLQEISPTNIACKNIARHTIKQLDTIATQRKLKTSEKSKLKTAINDFNKVAMPFDPYYYPKSSRKLEVEAVISKHQL